MKIVKKRKRDIATIKLNKEEEQNISRYSSATFLSKGKIPQDLEKKSKKMGMHHDHVRNLTLIRSNCISVRFYLLTI